MRHGAQRCTQHTRMKVGDCTMTVCQSIQSERMGTGSYGSVAMLQLLALGAGVALIESGHNYASTHAKTC